MHTVEQHYRSLSDVSSFSGVERDGSIHGASILASCVVGVFGLRPYFTHNACTDYVNISLTMLARSEIPPPYCL